MTRHASIERTRIRGIAVVALIVALCSVASAGRPAAARAREARSVTTAKQLAPGSSSSPPTLAASRRAHADEPNPAKKPEGRLAAIGRALRETRVIVSGGAYAGAVGLLTAGVGGGIVTPTMRRFKDKSTDNDKPAGVFGTVTGAALWFSATRYVSSSPALRGTEWGVGPVAVRSPVYGDRVIVPVVPYVFSISASRKGGIGIGLDLLPIWTRLPFLVAANVSVYVDHPALAPLGNKVLDVSAAVGARILGFGRGLRDAGRRLLEPLEQFERTLSDVVAFSLFRPPS